MIDLHTHILPGIDDGPTDWDDSLALARALSQAGVTAVAATSHMKPPTWDNRAEALTGLRVELSQRLDEEGVRLQIHPGAEHWWCGAVLDRLVAGGGQTYGTGTAALLEFHPIEGPRLFEQRLDRLWEHGIIIVLAHVERYKIFEGRDGFRRLARLVDKGLVAQVNLGSLGRGFSWSRGGAAKRMVQAGLIGLACGDCHRVKDVEPAYDRGLKALEKLGGTGVVERLLWRNPTRLLDGIEVDPWSPPQF